MDYSKTSIGRSAASLVVTVLMLAALGGPLRIAAADSAAPAPPPIPVPVPRPMPEDPARVNPIGGARVSSTTPQGETAGMERPLAAQVERGAATVPMWAKDGIFAPTAHPNRQIAIHLPGEVTLSPAAWLPGGGAVYGSSDVDYQVIPFAGGGVDITATRKTVFSASTIPFGVKMPAATHLRQGNNVVLVETDAAPGNPAQVIGTFSIPAASDANQALVGVTPTLGPGFPPGQSNLTIDLGPTSIFAFPVTITLSYRASDAATTGAPAPTGRACRLEHPPPRSLRRTRPGMSPTRRARTDPTVLTPPSMRSATPGTAKAAPPPTPAATGVRRTSRPRAKPNSSVSQALPRAHRSTPATIACSRTCRSNA